VGLGKNSDFGATRAKRKYRDCGDLQSSLSSLVKGQLLIVDSIAIDRHLDCLGGAV
jgi:hypothetical protein